MGEVRLAPDEVEVLRRVLRVCVIHRKSGQVGVLHGMNRFVSAHVSLRKQEREALDSVARKVGLSGMDQFDG